MKICTITNCEARRHSHGYCSRHTARLRRTGDPLGVAPERPAIERFLTKINKSGDCWLWTAGTNGVGYGVFSVKHQPILAHRFSYEHFKGLIPERYVVDHICHTPACVNPDHLRAVSNKQNIENRGALNVTNKSGFHGVCWHAKGGKWRAQVGHNGRQHYIGLFDDPEEAARAASAKRNELYTHNDLDRAA